MHLVIFLAFIYSNGNDITQSSTCCNSNDEIQTHLRKKKTFSLLKRKTDIAVLYIKLTLHTLIPTRLVMYGDTVNKP